MKQKAWLSGLVRGLVAMGVLSLAVGCASRPFAIPDRKMCRSIDGTGSPSGVTTTFTTSEELAYFWFRYTNAPPGHAVKVKFTHKGEGGTKTTQEARVELTAGSYSASAQLAPLQGGTLTAGQYDVEILSDADVAYGPPHTFTVQ